MRKICRIYIKWVNIMISDTKLLYFPGSFLRGFSGKEPWKIRISLHWARSCWSQASSMVSFVSPGVRCFLQGLDCYKKKKTGKNLIGNGGLTADTRKIKQILWMVMGYSVLSVREMDLWWFMDIIWYSYHDMGFWAAVFWYGNPAGIGCLIKGGTMHFEYISEVWDSEGLGMDGPTFLYERMVGTREMTYQST